MRKKDQEITDKELIEAIIDKATVCRIAFSEKNIPYIIPVNFGHKDGCLYIHSAPEGKKIDMIKNNNNVCFEVDIDHELIKSDSPCHFSMKYQSVIGFGKAFFIEGLEEKKMALDLIVGHYSDGSREYPEKIVRHVTIIKVEIDHMTGKQSGFGPQQD
ncbi:MAG: pyridoxamine 5'-phosphate oxidase family protein [Deltaproteobacteria bacterium]|nr:pyridoxamine 5'-phosphate oxidase family protein [Deltaproteobacteria bacterium]